MALPLHFGTQVNSSWGTLLPPAFEEGLIALLKPVCYYSSNFAVPMEQTFWEVCPTHLQDLIIENKRVKREQNRICYQGVINNIPGSGGQMADKW